MSKNLLIALPLALSFLSVPSTATANPNDEVVIVANQKISVVKVGEGRYVWRTAGGSGGLTSDARSAKKAARKAARAERKAAKGK